MWEAIRANSRRSNLLIGLMGALLVGFGALLAAAFAGPDLAWAGALLALGLWLALLLVAWTGGDRVALATAGARPISKEDAPQLWNITEEMTIASGLGQMPRLYIIDDDAPNAFATASRKGPAAVAVTAGLLRRLSRDELQGVIAHEIGHIRNRDVQFMTLALVMVGSIALMADAALRVMWLGGGRRRGSSGKGGGQAQAILLVVTLVAAILAPLAARLLYMACSRQREYLADASSARFTRYPAGLASALEKIAGGLPKRAEGAQGMRALAPLYIVTPLSAAGGGLFASHPPTAKRIEILRNMAGGAGWMDYESAYRQTLGGRARCLEPALLKEGKVAAREASPEPPAKQAAGERAREVADLLDRMADFLLIACACGMRIKVPEAASDETVDCPRCGRAHAVPRAEMAGAVAAAAALKTAGRAAAGQAPGTAPDGAREPAAAGGGTRAPLVYRRRGSGWESFRCGCGKVLQVSPSLSVSHLKCRGCGQRIDVRAA